MLLRFLRKERAGMTLRAGKRVTRCSSINSRIAANTPCMFADNHQALVWQNQDRG